MLQANPPTRTSEALSRINFPPPEARSSPPFLQESSSSWLDSVVPHLAGILELEDTPAIQMEVAFLARAFPDVQ